MSRTAWREWGWYGELRAFLRIYVRNRPAVAGAVVLIGMGLVAAFAPWVAPADPLQTELTLEGAFQPPGRDHIAGTDHLGRDVLSRTIFGARIAWQIVIVAIGLSVGIGVPLGLLAGYIGGKLDELVIMRVVDALMAMPGLILVLAITAALGPSLTNTMLVVGVIWSPAYARLTRGVVLSIKQEVYVEAARSVGASPLRTMWRHLLPNVVAPVFVLASLSAASVILLEAALSFIGAEGQPPTPAWGGMVSSAYDTLLSRNGWPILGPAVAIILMVMSFNFVGDGIQDAMDPRLRNVR